MRSAAGRGTLVAVLCALLLAGCAGPRAASERITLTLATATAGGGFEAYGRAFAEVVAARDPALEVRPLPSQGSVENVELLAAGKVDLALVTGEVAEAAFAGDATAGLKVLSVMYSSPGVFAVRADSRYRRIEDLRGQPVVFGARGSGLVVLARQVLDGMGLDMERDFRPILLERAADAPALVLDGRAAALWGGGADWPPFAALARAGARFIAPDGAAIDRIRERHGFLDRMELPAGSYAGQDGAIASVGSWSLVLVRAGLDEAVARRLARALHRGEQELARHLPRGRETRAATTAARVPAQRLHPGVLRYLAEAGLAQ